MKRCVACGQEREESDFYRCSNNSTKLRSRCKTCISHANYARPDPKKSRDRTRAWRAKNPGRTTANIRAWQKRNPDRHRANIRWSIYRIDFEGMWLAQGGKCAACGKPMLKEGRKAGSVCVDHDKSCCPGNKSCGKCVRGLIHWNCNMALGYAEDNPELLRKAIAYLRSFPRR